MSATMSSATRIPSRPWRVAHRASLAAVVVAAAFLVHSLASSYALELVAHHAGDPVSVHVALVGSALLVLGGPAILLAGLVTVRGRLGIGTGLLLAGGFLTVGLFHLYPTHALGLGHGGWGESAEAAGLLLAVGVAIVGWAEAWRLRRLG
jgi:hypothetical protein